MLSVIWGILKVIGILLLIILGLIFTLLFLVLFVPLRYECSLSGEYEKGAEEPPEYLVKARVSWLLRFVCIRVKADQAGAKVKLKLLGIPLGGKKKKRERKPAEPKPAEPKSVEPKPAEPKQTEPKQSERSRQKKKTEEQAEEAELSGAELLETASAGKQDSSEPVEQAGGLSFFKRFCEKLKALIRKISGFFRNLRCTFEKICDKIKGISDRAGVIRDFLKAEENREAFRYVKGEAGKLVRHILPKKLSGRIVFGLEDPAVTGKVLALLGIAYPLIGKRLSVTPLFENKLYLEGSIFLKGRIRVFSLLIIAIRVWFNKKFRGLLERGRGLKEQLSRA